MMTHSLDRLSAGQEKAQRKQDQARWQANRCANQIEYVQKRSCSGRTHRRMQSRGMFSA